MVLALAATSDGVADLQLRTLVVGEVVEVERRPVETVAVMEVVDVDDVLVVAAPRVDGMPAAEDEERSDDLVPGFLGSISPSSSWISARRIFLTCSRVNGSAPLLMCSRHFGVRCMP